jgi:hypothetical protein
MRAGARNSRINRRYQTCLSKASASGTSAQYLHKNPKIVEASPTRGDLMIVYGVINGYSGHDPGGA